MTRERAIWLLRRYRREIKLSPLYIPSFKGDYRFERYVYDRYLAEGLIREIRMSEDDPIRIVHEAYCDVDALILKSDNPRTHRFARMIQRGLGDILEMLRDAERDDGGKSRGEQLVLKAMFKPKGER